MTNYLSRAFLEDGSQVEAGKRYTVKLKHNETVFKMTLIVIDGDKHPWLGIWRLYKERSTTCFKPPEIESVKQGWKQS